MVSVIPKINITSDSGTPPVTCNTKGDWPHIQAYGPSTETLAELHIDPYIRRFLSANPKADAASTDSTVHRPSRWSDVIPPETALTFAAIWDPEDGMITFTGADLADALKSPHASKLVDSPSDVNEGSFSYSCSCSQVLTIDRFNLPSGPTTAALAVEDAKAMGHPFSFACEALADAGECFDGLTGCPGVPGTAWIMQRRSLGASSGAASVLLERIRKASRYGFDPPSFKGIVSKLSLVPRVTFANDHSFSPGRQPGHDTLIFGRDDDANLRSAFSTTTTSTSNYIHITSTLLEDLESVPTSSSWSTLDPPSEYSDQTLGGNEPTEPALLRYFRKLHRPRPLHDPPARPSEVLARSE